MKVNEQEDKRVDKIKLLNIIFISLEVYMYIPACCLLYYSSWLAYLENIIISYRTNAISKNLIGL